MPEKKDMHSTAFLAQELRTAGLEEMAKKAENGYYHEYISPLDFPSMQLVFDLLDEILKGNRGAVELRARQVNGEFNATKEEGDAWKGSSHDPSQEAERLMGGKSRIS